MRDGNARSYIRNPQDFYGGLVLLAFALIVLWLGRDLAGMRGAIFGPGTLPSVLAALLVITSLIIMIGGVVTDGPELERWSIRGPVLLIASILFFAATIRPLGMIISCFGTLLIASAASKEFRWVETIVWSAVLTACALALFYYGLKLPIQPWPR